MSGPRILLFTGEGKGKTTAALGMALRTVGHGRRVRVIQFLKANAASGELSALRDLPLVSLTQSGCGFVRGAEGEALQAHGAAAHAGLALARESLADPTVALVVLDEICGAVRHKLLDEGDVLAALRTARDGVVVVLTGRGASAGLIAAADTVTEMRCVKHAYQQGVAAQQGVEW